MPSDQYKRKGEEIKIPELGKPYMISLLETGKNGDFPCPKCGTMITPDDETEDTYKLIETGVKDNELDYVIVQCNKCNSMIKIGGFLLYNSNQTR